MLVFVLQWLSLHWEILIMWLSQFSPNFHQTRFVDAPFHRKFYDYSRADWGGLLSASAASEFCEWIQVGIDLCIPHCKYQVKPDSCPWLSAACAPSVIYGNHFFRLHQQNKSSESKVKFRQTSNSCKGAFEAAKLALIKQKSPSLPRNVTFASFDR